MAKNVNDLGQNFNWSDLFRSIWFILDKFKWKFIFWWIILTLVHFYSIVPPLIIGKIVDFFTTYNAGDNLSLFITLSITLGVSYAVVSAIRLSTKQVLGNLRAEGYLIKVKGFENILNNSLEWNINESTGSKVKRIENGIDAYKNLIGKINNDIVTAITTLIGVITVFIFLNPKYIIFFIGYTIIFFLILRFYLKKIQTAKENFNISLEKSGGSYVEGLGNILTIKTLGAGEDFKNHISNKELVAKEHEYNVRRIGINMWKSYQIFNGLCYGLFLTMVGFGVVNGEISTGSIVIFYGYLASLMSSSNNMLEIYEELLGAKISIGRMMPILQGFSDLTNGNLKFPNTWRKISLQNINFKYKDSSDKTSLKNINLEVRRGQSVGFVGKTGSGKSTIAKIIAGLYTVDSGNYFIGNTNFFDINKSEITEKISLVLQDSEMFNLSLKDNITLFRKINPELLQKAIKVSQLEEVIRKLPNGLNTIIGEKGYHLSGGERQRVGIARVICKLPEIIIFDESTSSLDSKTERLIYNGLKEMFKEKTVITIAHRINTIKNNDIIYVFDDGKIVEAGSYKSLSKNKSSNFFETYSNKLS